MTFLLNKTLVKISNDLPNELQKCMTKTTENQTSNSIATEIPRLGEVKSILEFEEGISTLQKNIRGSSFYVRRIGLHI